MLIIIVFVTARMLIIRLEMNDDLIHGHLLGVAKFSMLEAIRRNFDGTARKNLFTAYTSSTFSLSPHIFLSIVVNRLHAQPLELSFEGLYHCLLHTIGAKMHHLQ